MTTSIATLETQFGRWGVEVVDDVITRLIWNAEPVGDMTPLLTEAINQLDAYIHGQLIEFSLPLARANSDFQQQVQDAMLAIPFGETRTYGDIATALNAPAQAVGQACGANPIPIIIPCHRVLAKSGIGGFSGWGGVEGKIALLKHESGFPYLI